MSLDDDIRLVVRAIFVGMKTVIVEPISQEWTVRGTRSKHGIKIDISYKPKTSTKGINTRDAI